MRKQKSYFYFMAFIAMTRASQDNIGKLRNDFPVSENLGNEALNLILRYLQWEMQLSLFMPIAIITAAQSALAHIDTYKQ